MADYTAPVPVPGANMGKADPRVEARDKVTGSLVYAADMPLANPAFAYFVTSAIAKGKIRGFDLTRAKALPGVIDVFTHENLPKRVDVKFMGEGGYVSNSHDPLGSAEVVHDGQIVAVVVAETYEVARDAAHRVHVDYAEQSPSATLTSAGTKTDDAADVAKGWKDKVAGNFDRGWARSAVTVEADYSTPTQHHNPIELFSTTAVWHGDELTIYEPSQFVWGLKNGVARNLDIDVDKVKVVNPFVGGAFGSKGMMTQRTGIVARIARIVGRPVKLVATRDQGYTIATYRAETSHHIKLGADAKGRLTALSHDGWELSSRNDAYKVGGTEATTQMYACPDITSKVRIVSADRQTPGFMRSPPEVPYMFALECAIDELAEKCGIDPVEFRRINDTQKSPITGEKFTSRHLIECFDAGAKAFGWATRGAVASQRDGDWLVGYGTAATCYPAQTMPATARVRLSPDGHVRVQTAAHDVGTGATTIMGQIAAEAFGVPLANVSVEMGDSRLPPGPVAGGSMTTASAGSAVKAACDKVIAKFGNRLPPTGDALVAAFKKLNLGVVEEYAEWAPPKSKGGVARLYEGQMSGGAEGEEKPMLAFAYGAEFVEVHVHARTKEIRVPRILGAFAAGRIMNPRTARSQLMGGLIWGISSALHEATEIDAKRARYVNDNLSEYLIPVNADIRSVEVIMLSETDDQVPMGAKGIGELGNVGTNAAIANAVYHATGKRIRELPITIDKLIA